MNKLKNTIKTSLVILTLLGMQTAIVTPQAFALGIPFAVQGQVTLDGAAADGASVTLTDANTGAFLTDTVGAAGASGISGWYAFDLGNLSIAATDGDNINIVATAGGLTGTTSFVYNSVAGFTNPPTIAIVSPVLTSVTVSPVSASIFVGSTQPLVASPLDQFAAAFAGATITWSSSDTAVATVDVNTGLVTAVAVGTSTITASAVSGAITVTGTSVISVNAVPVLTTINVSPTSTAVYIGATQQFSAVSLDQYGNPFTAAITWSSSNTAVGTIDATGLFTAVANGTTTITATSGAISGMANATVSATPVLTSILVSPTSTALLVGTTTQFSATALDQFGVALATQPAFTWASNNTAVATIDAAGLLTAVSAGTSTITATSGAVSGTASVVVNAVPVLTSIALTPTSTIVSIVIGTSTQLTATAIDQFGVALAVQPAITWSSASSTIASVDATGLVTGISVGTTTITASSGAVSASITANITSVPVLATINMSPTSTLVYIGATRQFTATSLDQLGNPIVATITWSSSNTAVGTIDATGLFTAVANGTTTITATSGAISGMANVTVAPAPVLTTIQVTPIAGIIKVGNTLEMKAKGYDQAGIILAVQPVFTWSSSNTTAASISASGLVMGLAVGTSTITATSGAVSGSTIITITTSTIREISDDCRELEDSGALVPEWGEDYWESRALTATNNIRFTIHDIDGNDEIELPEGVRISGEDGLSIDGRSLIATSTIASFISGLDSSLRTEGALKWGLANRSLMFSSPITLRIFVGAGHNGQTLGIARSITGAGAWTSDGIASPATCVISSGVCSFQATKASYYVVTSQAPAPTPAPTGNVLGTPGGGGGGGGSGMLATGAPVWLSAEANNTASTGSNAQSTSQGAVLGASTFNFVGNLAVGSRGDAVTELQKRLALEGVYTGPITGYFGNLTFVGVKAYQAKYGIIQTGFVGPLTRGKLNSGQVAGVSTINMDAIVAQIAVLQAKVQELMKELQQMQIQ